MTARNQRPKGHHMEDGSFGKLVLRIGGLLFLVSGFLLATYYFLGFDISTAADTGKMFEGSRFVNLGKMSDRQSAISYGTLLVILGMAGMWAGHEDE